MAPVKRRAPLSDQATDVPGLVARGLRGAKEQLAKVATSSDIAKLERRIEALSRKIERLAAGASSSAEGTRSGKPKTPPSIRRRPSDDGGASGRVARRAGGASLTSPRRGRAVVADPVGAALERAALKKAVAIEPGDAEAIEEGLADIRAGRVTGWDEAMAELHPAQAAASSR